MKLRHRKFGYTRARRPLWSASVISMAHFKERVQEHRALLADLNKKIVEALGVSSSGMIEIRDRALKDIAQITRIYE